jgi:predicted small secreted protein
MARLVSRLLCVVSVLAISGLTLVSVSGCQTVKGLGQDVKNAGEAGERAIDSDKN